MKFPAVACRSIILAASFAGTAGGAAAATQETQEQIGSWIISCSGEAPKSGTCLMRTNKRLLDKAGVSGDLEVRTQGRILVPVIVLRAIPPKF